ncbi:MAG: PEP-CTERM sorting domain-containing protein [Rubrivivax sp.]|nr:PEP-CTERM sorting domain-containing protein [Rubrivivax sp.]
MRLIHSSFVACVAVVLAAVAPGEAAAQSTWNLGSAACGSGGGTQYTTLTCTGSSTTEVATMTAWGNTGNSGTTFVQGTLANWDPNGFGAITGSREGTRNGHHAFDSKTAACGTSSSPTNANCGGSTELMLISFGPYKVNLTSIAIGWSSGDADVSMLRWDGSGDPSLVGKSTSTLAGWTLVGSQDLDELGKNFDNPNTSGTTLDAYKSTIGLGNQVSSYWMISTYFGTNDGNLNAGNDAFKVLNFTANICTSGNYSGGNGGNGGTCSTGSVPEPGSLALAGLALFGVVAGRRRGRAIV